MSWVETLSYSMAILLGLLILGFPIFVGFLVLNLVGIIYLIGTAGIGMFANSIYATSTFAELSAIPLFILMGEVLFRSGAMDVLLDSIDSMIGKIKGRQYILCTLLSGVLGALCGAAMAVAGLLGRTLYPTMLKRGYDSRLAAGSILGGASLSPIIPPSVLAIVIATLAKVSTGKMLVAGILPGILLMVVFLAYILIRVALNSELSPDVSSEVADRGTSAAIKAFIRVLPIGLVFFMIMGFIMLGIATPTESAAAGVFASVIVAWHYGGLSLTMLKESLYSGAKVSCVLLIIMVSAAMFSQLMAFSGAVRHLAEFIAGMGLSPYLMLLIMLGLPFVLFMFLDQVSLLMVLIPIYQPVLGTYGFDPIWFWTLMLIVATVGGISPPFGYTLFAFKGSAPDMSVNDTFKAAWPFVGLMALGVVLLVVFPSIVTFLPELSVG